MSKNKDKKANVKGLRSLLYNNKFVLLLSVILAFGIWIWVSIEKSPEVEVTISSVPVKIDLPAHDPRRGDRGRDRESRRGLGSQGHRAYARACEMRHARLAHALGGADRQGRRISRSRRRRMPMRCLPAAFCTLEIPGLTARACGIMIRHPLDGRCCV